MASHRSPRSTLDGLPIVAIAAALMAPPPSGGRWRAGGDEPAAIDRGAASALPGRHAPDRTADRHAAASLQRRFSRC
jgi:hypothetical protein